MLLDMNCGTTWWITDVRGYDNAALLERNGIMADFVEQAINNYSGLSSETKPTIAAGNTVPNGSRWREVDTGLTYHFNLSDDIWYITPPR